VRAARWANRSVRFIVRSLSGVCTGVLVY